MKYLSIIIATAIFLSSPFLPSPAHGGFIEGAIAMRNEDIKTAMDELLPLAEEGDPRSQLLVGIIYAEQDNTDEAYKWFRKAAAQGEPMSRKILENQYEYK